MAIKDNTQVSFKIVLSKQEGDYVTEQAKTQKVSKQKYMKTKILDSTCGVQELTEKIMKQMPEFYTLVGQIEDTHIRTRLIEIGGQLCRF